MNLVTFGLILICCHAWAIEMDDNFFGRFFETTSFQKTPLERTPLENFLENFKEIIRHGNDTLGIPPLDPAIAEELFIKFNGSAVVNGNELRYDIDAQLRDARADGLSEYIVQAANFKIFGFEITANLLWPLIIAKADNYTLNAQLEVIPVYGSGKVDLTVTDFNFDTKINLEANGLYLRVAKIATNLSLSSFDLKVTGLYYDEEISAIISEFVSKLIYGLISSKDEMVLGLVNDLLKGVLDGFLSTMTLADLLKLIGGIGKL